MHTDKKYNTEFNKPYIYLYKEGLFWRAYNLSAHRLQQTIKLKVIKNFVKKVGSEIVYVGIPESKLNEVLAKFKEYKRLSNLQIVLKIEIVDNEKQEYNKWFNNLDLNDKTSVNQVSKQYRPPPIFSETVVLYKEYYAAHGNLPKLFRVTIGEHILKELAEMMRIITMANFANKEQNKENSVLLLQDLRGRTEVVKTWFLVAWELKHISHGLYGNLSKRIVSISKQAARWQQFLQKQ